MKFRFLMLACFSTLIACSDSDQSQEDKLDSNLPVASHAVTKPIKSQAQSSEKTVSGDDQEPPPVTLELYNESAYQNENGDWMLDVIAGQLAFIDVTLVDREDIPVSDQALKINASRGSALLGAERSTDDNGNMQFAVRPVQQGEERLIVAWNGVRAELLLNVIADEALQWKGMDDAEGVVSWETLLASRVTYLDDAVRIDFTKEVQALDKKEVSVIGFILPLESLDAQKHFLLVSTPPSCFFHLPGGPVGAIEVFAEEGVEFGWNPVRLKGRFELHAPDEYGAVYRLHEAKQEALDS